MNKNEGIFLFNKQRTHVKRFRKFENISNKENDFIYIDYCCVCKSSTKPIDKGSRIESLKDTTDEYKKTPRKRLEENKYF